MTSLSSPELPEPVAKRQRIMLKSDGHRRVSGNIVTPPADTPSSSGRSKTWDKDQNTLLVESRNRGMGWLDISQAITRKFGYKRSGDACRRQYSQVVNGNVPAELLPDELSRSPSRSPHPDRPIETPSDQHNPPETRANVAGTILIANPSEPTREITPSHDPMDIEDLSAPWEAELSGLARMKEDIADLQRRRSDVNRAMAELQQRRNAISDELARKERERQVKVDRMTIRIKQTAGVDDPPDAA